MKHRLLLTPLLVAVTFLLHAQDRKNIRTDVLVVGEGSAAVGAALQSAISGANTVLLTSEKEFNISLTNASFKSGLEASFLKRIRKAENITDSTATVRADKTIFNSVFKEWADSTKGLAVFKDAQWNKLDRQGSGWLVKLDNGTNIKAKVLVYAIQQKPNTTLLFTQTALSTPLDYSNNLYRTSIAGGHNNGRPSITSLYSLIKTGEENLVVANAAEADLVTGQAAGATAAYAGFFKVKTSLSDLKAIQGELLHYKLSLIPFNDVAPADTNWRAIQNVGLTGILKAEIKDKLALFKPEQPVAYAEIKQPLKDYIYKAQIWFDDHPDAPVTLENTIAMVSYLGNKSAENTRSELEKKWKSNYQFTSDFDLKKVLTRREFAVLVNDYLRPTDIKTDQTGRILR